MHSIRGLTARLIVLSILCCSTLHATETLRASFDTGLDADRAVGSKKAYTRNVTRVPGKTGRAVRIGEADQFLFYPVKDNLNLMKGTVAMWVKPVGFSPSEVPEGEWDGFEFFRVSSNRDEIRLELIRHNRENNTNRCLQIQTCPVQPDGVGGGPNRIRAYGWIQRHLRKLQVPWAEGEFRHIAGTWDFGRGVLEVYIDGEQAARVQDDNLKKRWGKAPNSFQIGPYKGIKQPAGADAKGKGVVLDEVRVFDQALSAAEIAGLAGRASAGDYDRKKDYRLPLITVGRTGKRPKIDGKVGQGEWDAAAGVAGFVAIGNATGSGFLTADDVTVKIAYDSERLYALFITPLDKMPPAHTGEADHYDKNLDMIELWLAPDRSQGDVFQFIGAPLSLIHI